MAGYNQAMWMPRSGGGPSSKVEVSISCRNLRDRDVVSKSDPMCILFMTEFGSDKLQETGRTEVIYDNINPDFVHKFQLEYRFEEHQKLKFAIYDFDSDGHHDSIGFLETSLGQLVSSKTYQTKLKDKHGTDSGTIIVRTEEILACNDELNIKLSGQKLDKKDFLGKSDPFLVFYKSNEDQSYTAVHKTEVIRNTLSPSWREFYISVSQLCNGDLARNLKVECYDWDCDGDHDMIGEFFTTGKELSTPNKSFELVNPKKKAKKKGYINSGLITVEHSRITKQYGFLEYIQAGVQVNFTVAVDFTASNGDPNNPNSLHYRQDFSRNQYITAINSVGNIIQDYDSDRMFPALGFGAKFPNGVVSHEFFLNGNPTNPFCSGIAGVLQAYQSAIQTVELWGPTNFSPVINHVARFAEAMRDGSNYFILLIITDGVISDIDSTKQSIIAASKLPMSIIIVGVGNADFSEMDVLDGDGGLLKAQGHVAERDIVQFVPLVKYLTSGDSYMVQARLAKDVLAEVPRQFTSYMKAHGIQPPSQRIHQALQPQATSPPSM